MGSSRERGRATDRRILALAWPALGSLAVEPLYVLVDTAIVGRLGTSQLGGLAIAAAVLTLVFAGCNFLTYGATERVARRLGAGRPGEAADVGVQTLWLSVIVGLVMAPVIGFCAPWLARFLGADGVVVDHATTYLRISALGIPFILVTLGAQGVMRGASDYRRPLVILLVANLINVVVELIFVYGFDWGVAGSAWSTVIAQVGAAGAFVAMSRRHLAAATQRAPSWAGMAPLMSAGKYLLLRTGSMLAVITGATAIAARIDEPTLAAHQIVFSLFGFLALALDALAVPAQTLVAEELGRHGETAAAMVAERSARLSWWAGLTLAVPLAVLARALPRIFTDDGAVIDRATSGIWWLAVLLVPASMAFAYDGSLIGAGDYQFLGRAAFAYLAVAVPLGLVVLLVRSGPVLGIGGIWAALTAWVILRAGVNRWRARTLLGVI